MMIKKPYILKLDISGTPVAWITWQRAVEYCVTGKIAWSYGSNTIEITGGVSRMTGLPVKLQLPPIIAVKGKVQAKSTSKFKKHPRIHNTTLFRRDSFQCAYCGDVYHHSKLSRDHVLPISRGGRNTWLNIVTSCRICNHKKGCRTLRESGMSLLYEPYVPSKIECLIFGNRTGMTTEQRSFLNSYFKENNVLVDKLSNTKSFVKENTREESQGNAGQYING